MISNTSKSKLKYVAAALAGLASTSAMSADWNVLQDTNISGASPSLLQSDVSASNQALNGAVLDRSNDNLTNTVQSVTAAGSNLTLSQSGTSTSNSVQAANLAVASSIENLSQNASGFDTIQISQSTSAGGGNVQAVNYAMADGTITNLSQTASGNTLITIDSSATNLQAVNYTEATSYNGTLEQSVTFDTVDITNLGGLTTRINSISGDTTGVTGAPVQTTTIGTLTVNPGSMVVLNHIDP